MALRRAFHGSAGTSTRLIARATVTGSHSLNARAVALTPYQGSEIFGRWHEPILPSTRGFASAMPATTEAGENVAAEPRSIKFFRPVEKLANGVAIIRWEAVLYPQISCRHMRPRFVWFDILSKSCPGRIRRERSAVASSWETSRDAWKIVVDSKRFAQGLVCCAE